MVKDVLVILMVAFGIFTIIMFVLFYVYLRKYYNRKHLVDDYEKIEDDFDDDLTYNESVSNPPENINPVSLNNNVMNTDVNVNNNIEVEDTISNIVNDEVNHSDEEFLSLEDEEIIPIRKK